MKEDCIMITYKGSGVDILTWPFVYKCNKIDHFQELLNNHLTTRCSIFYYEPILEINKLYNKTIKYKNIDEPYILNNFIVKNN